MLFHQAAASILDGSGGSPLLQKAAQREHCRHVFAVVPVVRAELLFQIGVLGGYVSAAGCLIPSIRYSMVRRLRSLANLHFK
ncbi:MAG: hypothetical protein AB2L14_18055 [Candidatus Xenobiia bacterium LiM19]